MKKIVRFTFLLGLLVAFLSCETTKNPVLNPVTEIKQPDSGDTLQWNSDIEKGVLDNGMAYYVMKNSEPKNRIYLRLVVKAGSVNEDDDQKGVAHFVEHLAFNGTKNFQKSAIVDYFEKIGMGFGPEVNAYTSFEETVYMLEIPADDPQILKTSLLVLHDWASAISFDPVEIEKERGVVTEEWRLSQGLNRRITETQIPLLLKDSIYENRLPIGDMDVIKNVKRERILDFYKKNYCPENMAIVAVGDVDTAVLEKAIKEAMKDIPASGNKYSKSTYNLPKQTEKKIGILIDKEQKYPVVNIYFQKEEFGSIKTKEDFRQSLLNQMAMAIFNERLASVTNTSLSPWLTAQAGEYNMTNTCLYGFLGFVPKDGQFEDALKRLFLEFDIFRMYGCTESELQRIKQILLIQEEQYYKNKDKITSDAYINGILQYELIEKIPVSENDVYKLYNEIIPSVTAEELNQKITEIYENRGTAMLVVGPDTSSDILSEKQIMEIWKNYQDEITAYEEEVSDNVLMDKPKNKGRVVSKKENSSFDGNEYILSNGIKIITKKTDFQTNTINIVGTSFGGTNYVSDQDFPSAQIAIDYTIFSGVNGMSYNDFVKKISTMNFGFNAGIGVDNEYISGAATGESIENFLQLTNLLFTKPQFTDEGWNVLMGYIKNQADSYGKQPNEVLLEEIKRLLYNDNIRFSAITPEFAAKMDQKTAEKIYRERFGNIADFTFVFVGDYDEKVLLDLCCVYLGSIATTKNVETVKDILVPFPKGIQTSTVYKGVDKQGIVYLAFGGDILVTNDVKKDFLEVQKIYMLKSLLEIRLREVIREEKGGSYGVSVNTTVEGNNKKQYTIQISFGCEPEREDELLKETIKQIELIKKETVNEDYIQKISETVKRTYEMNYRNNQWIMENIISSEIWEDQPKDFYDLEKDVLSLVSAKTLKETAQKYLNTNQYINVNLKPEK